MHVVPVIPYRLYGGGQLDKAGWQFVKRHIGAVLNVTTVPDHPPFDFTGRLLLWTPILDKVPPNLLWTITVTNLMNVVLDNGIVLYVHDTAGINRLGFILTAYFMQKYGYRRDEALSILRRRMPQLNPRPEYMALLALYENYLSRPSWTGAVR